VHGVLQCLVASIHSALQRARIFDRRHGAGAAALILVGVLTNRVAVLGSFAAPQWIAGIYLGVGGGAQAAQA
jgi:hypothetical protein